MENFLVVDFIISSLAIVILFLVFINYSDYKRNTNTAATTPFLFHLALILSTVALPLLVLILISFWIYRQLITFILFMRHGSKFGGLLGGIDATHTTESALKTPVHFLFVIQYKENSSQNFLEFVKQTLYKICLRKLNKIPKVFASLENSFGYSYLLKNQIQFEDCFKQLKILKSPTSEIDQPELMRIISEYSDCPLPKNSKSLWDVLVGTQAITWKENCEDHGQKFYPIVLRFNHSLIDGVSLLQGILEMFADSGNYTLNKKTNHQSELVPEALEEVTTKMNNVVVDLFVNVVTKAKYCIQILNAICLIPSAVLGQAWFKRNDSNILYGPRLSNRKIVSLNVEESPQYVKIIKNLKKKIDDCTFNDVLLTAITASLNEYFEQKSVKTPDYILAAVPADRRATNIRNTTITKSSRKLKMCQNESSIFIPKLPIKISYEDADTALINRLKLVQRETALFKNSRTYETNYWLLRIFGTVFTRPIGDFLANLNTCTIGVSNLPGIPNITVFEGYPLQDIAFWLANRERTGVAVSILTYGGRLQMGLLVDSVLISEQSEVDSILNGVYKYIDLLYHQVNCSTI